jgi:hypothetical protein
VAVCELRSHRRGQSSGRLGKVFRRSPKCILRFLRPAQFVQYQALMNQRLDVLRIKLERALELFQRSFGLTEQR